MSRRFDVIASLVFLAVGILFVMGARDLSKAVYGSSITSGTFPLVFGWSLVVLSALLLLESLKKSALAKKEAKPLFYKRFAIIAAACLVYVLLLQPLGYVITTFLFLIVCFQAMQRGDWAKTLLIAAGFSLGIYLLFVVLLKGSLPAWPSFI
jgi:putative tricarboxylic transport membrane protein